MKNDMNIIERVRANIGKKQLAAIVALLVLGAVGAVAILSAETKKPAGDAHGHGHSEAEGHGDGEHHGAGGGDSHGHDEGHEDGEHHEEEPKGPNGGQLLSEGDFSAELLLTEQGGEPRLKVWLLDKGKPVAPGTTKVNVELTRPGGDVEKYSFVADKGALVSTTPVAEPHIFEGTVEIQTPKEPYLFPFSQNEGVVNMSEAQMESAGVTLDTAAPGQIRSALQLPGEIGFNEDRTAHVVPRVAGVVEAVSVSLGQAVRKGQTLAVISSAQVSEQRSELQAAQKRMQLARSTYEREQTLFKEKISPQQDVLTAEQALREAEIAVANAHQKLGAVGATPAAASLNRFELRAPFDGVVVEKHLALGEQVKEDTNVFTISDLRVVWAQLNVSSKDLTLVRVGGRVTIRSTAFDQSATGTVAYVGSLIGEQTRTAQARVAVNNPDMAWRPGLFVNVEVTANEETVPVTVAADGVQTIEDKTVVFLRSGDGFVPQPVQVGRSDGKRVEIVKGLKAGSRYAAAGAFVVKSEAGKASATHAH